MSDKKIVQPSTAGKSHRMRGLQYAGTVLQKPPRSVERNRGAEIFRRKPAPPLEQPLTVGGRKTQMLGKPVEACRRLVIALQVGDCPSDCFVIFRPRVTFRASRLHYDLGDFSHQLPSLSASSPELYRPKRSRRPDSCSPQQRQARGDLALANARPSASANSRRSSSLRNRPNTSSRPCEASHMMFRPSCSSVSPTRTQ